ncbi:hypothetical protein N7488_008597 [Penicillium malachiteum]|nr:hypothetical protein N7488_008597 [Penicillium malachiteum]
MCRFDFYTVLAEWWNSDSMDRRFQNKEEENLLDLATKAGCFPIFQRLVEKSNTNGLFGGASRSLKTAPREGNRGIVDLLIKKQATLGLTEVDFGNALAAAAYGGSLKILKILIKKGSSVNMVHGSALAAAAAYRGSLEIFNVLIASVDIVLQNGRFGSALAVSAQRGSLEIVNILIEKGASVDMVLPGYYGSPLAAAAAARQTEIARYLIDEV